MHLVTHGHFWSHEKDSDHTIRSAVVENPMLHENITVLCLIERELLPIDVLHCRNKNLRPFWLLWPCPWPDDLHIRTRPENRGDTPHVQIWTSYVKAFKSCRLTHIQTETDRQTDTDIHTGPNNVTHAASRVVNIRSSRTRTYEIKQFLKLCLWVLAAVVVRSEWQVLAVKMWRAILCRVKVHRTLL